MADYTKALVDIEQALNSGYPAELRYKLVERQAKCLMALGKSTDQVTAACHLAIKYVNESRLDQAKRDQFERDVKQLMEESRSLTVQLTNGDTGSIAGRVYTSLALSSLVTIFAPFIGTITAVGV